MFKQNNATSEEVWQDLESGLDQVFKRVAMAPARYMELYTHVFNFCTSSTVPQQIERTQPRRRQGNEPLSADFLGLDLCNKLSEFIRQYVVDVNKRGQDVVGEDLLKFYTHEWINFRCSSHLLVIDGIFSYLNRRWSSKSSKRDETLSVIYITALVIWRDEFFSHVKKRLTNALKQVFKSDRCTDVVVFEMLKQVTKSYGVLSDINECKTSIDIAIEHEVKKALDTFDDDDDITRAKYVDNEALLQRRAVDREGLERNVRGRLNERCGLLFNLVGNSTGEEKIEVIDEDDTTIVYRNIYEILSDIPFRFIITGYRHVVDDQGSPVVLLNLLDPTNSTTFRCNGREMMAEKRTFVKQYVNSLKIPEQTRRDLYYDLFGKEKRTTK